MRETSSERKSRTKISRMNWPLHAAPRPLRSAIPFLSLALFARVFLFSLTPVYFFLLSSARAYVTAGRFIETLVTRFQVPRLARNLPRLSNPIYSLFSIAPFFLPPSLIHDAKSAFSRHSSSLFRSPGAQHPPSFLKRSILFSPLVVLHTPSPSPPSLLLPRKSSSPLSVLQPLFSHPQSSALLGALVVPFLPLRSSNFLPSSATSSRRHAGGGNARENHSRALHYARCLHFSPITICPTSFLQLTFLLWTFNFQFST